MRPGEGFVRLFARLSAPGVIRRRIGLMAAIACLLMTAPSALALEAIRIPPGSQLIDLLPRVEHQSATAETIQISTAPGADGIVRRIAVKAVEAGARPTWIAFALSNGTDEQIEKLLVAPHYLLVGSGIIQPDLGAQRNRRDHGEPGLLA